MSWGGPDLVFRNDLKNAILVKVSYTNTTFTVSFYGTKQRRRVEATTSTPTNYTQPRLQYAIDPSAPPNSVRTAAGGGPGFNVNVHRKVYQDGKLLRQDDYFSRAPASGVLVDPDGDASVNAIDVNAGRNAFTTPPFVNLDMRFAKRFNVTSGVKAQVLLEFFNIFNRQNPAAVGRRQDVALEPFGRPRKYCRDEKGRSVSGSSSKQGLSASSASDHINVQRTLIVSQRFTQRKPRWSCRC